MIELCIAVVPCYRCTICAAAENWPEKYSAAAELFFPADFRRDQIFRRRRRNSAAGTSTSIGPSVGLRPSTTSTSHLLKIELILLIDVGTDSK